MIQKILTNIAKGSLRMLYCHVRMVENPMMKRYIKQTYKAIIKYI
jgi:hypothetical protein